MKNKLVFVGTVFCVLMLFVSCKDTAVIKNTDDTKTRNAVATEPVLASELIGMWDNPDSFLFLSEVGDFGNLDKIDGKTLKGAWSSNPKSKKLFLVPFSEDDAIEEYTYSVNLERLKLKNVKTSKETVFLLVE